MAFNNSADLAVFRPPPPSLGNFSKVFDDYMELASGTEPKIDRDEMEARLAAITFPSVESRIPVFKFREIDFGTSKYDWSQLFKTFPSNASNPSNLSSVKTSLQVPKLPVPRKVSPRLVKAAMGILSGEIKEFVPSPPQDAVDNTALPDMPEIGLGRGLGYGLSAITSPVHNSSPDTSDIVQNETYIFDEAIQYASFDSTPMSSPDTIAFAKPSVSYAGFQSAQGSTTVDTVSQITTMTYNYNAVGSKAGSVQLQNKVAIAHNATTISNNHGSPVSSNTSSTISSVKFSPCGTFRYIRTPYQYLEGVEMYAVDVLKSEGFDRIKPHYMATKQDKMRVLESKMQFIFDSDRATQARAPPMTDSVHVFIDLSNITIGFYDCIKKSHNIPSAKRMKAPRISFNHLSYILERGRNVNKRILAGSMVSTYQRKWPAFMQEAKEIGYEMNILERVPKAVLDARKNNQRAAAGEPEWTTSSGDSSTEDTYAGQLKQGEQGVDELLHLKILQSGMDYQPGTAVVATGDAAEAEYSDGFKSNVDRLLTKGWNVEVIGWSKGISSAWRDPEFLAKYGDRIRVIELDSYVEEIFGSWFGAPGY